MRALVLLASSYVMHTFQVSPFSNSIEAILVAASLRASKSLVSDEWNWAVGRYHIHSCCAHSARSPASHQTSSALLSSVFLACSQDQHFLHLLCPCFFQRLYGQSVAPRPLRPINRVVPLQGLGYNSYPYQWG